MLHFLFCPKICRFGRGQILLVFRKSWKKKTKGRISEKSFYNSFKQAITRNCQDVLDMFARMVGEINWKDFVRKNIAVESPKTESVLAEKLSEMPIIKPLFWAKWKIALNTFQRDFVLTGAFFMQQDKRLLLRKVMK